jgi:hypothetical protein
MIIPNLEPISPMWIRFNDTYGGDLIATLPYVLPAIVIATLLFLFQRGLPQTETKRNVSLVFSILLFGGSFLLIIYAAFGAVWWGPENFTFGSYGTVMAVLQIFTDFIFGDVFIGIVYVLAVGIVIALVAKFTLVQIEPDVAAMISEINATKAQNEKLQTDLQEIEAENKQLQVFLGEREDSLSTIQTELESLRAMTEETKAAAIEEPPEVDHDLLSSISEKDEQIHLLESRIIELENKLLEPSEPAIPPDVAEKQKLFEEFNRRAETATQVADSVISDTLEVISMIQSSELDESAKLILIKLIENLSKSLTKVAGAPELKDKQEPKIEMIGAVMIVHEIVDVVKKMSRG